MLIQNLYERTARTGFESNPQEASDAVHSMDHAVLKLTPATPGGVQRFGPMVRRFRLPCRIS